MKNIFTSLIIILSLKLSAQKIDYSFPEGYENEISKKDYTDLVNESVKAISKNYKVVSVEKGVIELEKGQDYNILNLHNLILKCSEVGKEKWISLINSHFDSMYESMEKQKQLDQNKFETLIDYLTIRIYQESFVIQNGGIDNLIAKKDLDGTFSVLMLDLPSAFTPIKKDMFNLWNKKSDEVFNIAQKNVNKQEFTKGTETIDADGQKIDISFIENENYGASIALDLKNNAPEFIGELGSVIAIPNKGIVNIFKISKNKPLDFMLFIQKCKPIVENFFNQHPQPISKDFYWYYSGKFTKINIAEKNGEFIVIAPIGLTELMAVKK
ncbi:hypothetical protein Q361_1451 [Flavobacterium croceum DSM 17960]|uniref:Uncharacterized protein n=1 Tax=Flavobacterium croceum DSM 17960 TaxID=1121886 RepID=A0A2S4N4M9_9FLAO|nr:hypothetical protein [Flavobacterium croceum]POS00610.1 hypothetical protein Q361_1451 [Flavobacterium croceum DSM 17960]